MLKITVHPAPSGSTIKVEGRLAGPWVEELERCWRAMAEPDPGRVMLDLTGVTFIDCEGKALLARMWRHGAKIHAAGCLTRCIVEEITNSGCTDSPPSPRKQT